MSSPPAVFNHSALHVSSMFISPRISRALDASLDRTSVTERLVVYTTNLSRGAMGTVKLTAGVYNTTAAAHAGAAPGPAAAVVDVVVAAAFERAQDNLARLVSQEVRRRRRPPGSRLSSSVDSSTTVHTLVH